jgi:hypothetical protein
MVIVAWLGCQKAPPHRNKRVHPHQAAPALGEDPAAPSAAATPAATPAPPPAPVAPPAPPAEPAPPPSGLTVDRTVPTPLPPPRRSARHASRVAAVAAAPPEPQPVRAAYHQVDDKPQGGGPCAGGTSKGERLAVQGVAADDVLNVREAPDKASAVLGALPPDATGVRGLANRRRVGTSSWREVECGQLHGWVNERFLAPDNGHE